MPRATSATKDPNALKRNQACHQCRKRKLKCDAGHPCLTCVRSHAFAMRTAQSTGGGNVSVPPLECTYDDSSQELWQESSQSRFEKLESKINTLETQLREATERLQQKDRELSQTPSDVGRLQETSLSIPGAGSSHLLSVPSQSMAHTSSSASPAGSVRGSDSVLSPSSNITTSTPATSHPPNSHTSARRPYVGGAYGGFMQPTVSTQDQFCTMIALEAIGSMEGCEDPVFTTLQSQSTDPAYSQQQQQYAGYSVPCPTNHERLPKVNPFTMAELGIDTLNMTTSSTTMFGQLVGENKTTGSPEATSQAVLDQSWPQFLPPPELLLHLVDTFFTCHPHAGRVLHRGSFMASLAYPPNAPQFPLPALLHSICAVASFYTAIVDPPDMPAIDDMVPEEIFRDPHMCKPNNHSFGEMHAMWATLSAARAIQSGERMLQVVQSTLILAWFQYTSGSAVNVWILIGKACRITAPLGINVSASYGSLSRFNRLPALIPPAKGPIEAEERRNLFWLIYAAERFHTAGTCWSMLLDDDDISQFLPLGDEQFNSEKTVPDKLRQRLASPNLLLVHPPEITSPFSLFIKSTAALSKVKVFNVRFRTKYGDTHGARDPRGTAEFQELDKLLQDFRGSWPREFRNPISLDGMVDPTLYLASIVPDAAVILLHDPHADFNSAACPSAQRMLKAAANVMESIYNLSSTSFDVLLLDHVTSFVWFVVGACLVRALKAKMIAGATAEMMRVNSEIDVVRMMLLKLGERTIIGRRQIKLLNEHFAAEINGEKLFQALGAFVASGATIPFQEQWSAAESLKVRQMLNITQRRDPHKAAVYMSLNQGPAGVLLGGQGASQIANASGFIADRHERDARLEDLLRMSAGDGAESSGSPFEMVASGTQSGGSPAIGMFDPAAVSRTFGVDLTW